MAVNEEFVLDGVDDLLRELATARRLLTFAQAELECDEAVLADIPEWQAYQQVRENVTRAQQVVNDVDKQVREAVVRAYVVVQVKQIAPGASVQVSKDTLRIRDVPAAVAWAKQNMPVAIVESVDNRVLRFFEGEAKLPEWIEVAPGSVSARIATDLTQYLPKAVEEG